MATYRFRVMPSGEPYYETEGNGINWGVAQTNVARREGVSKNQLCYLGEVKDSEGDSTSVSSIGGTASLIGVLFIIWLFAEYFWIMAPLTLIIIIALIWNWFSD